MALKVLVKAESNVSPSDFTVDIAALLASGGLSAHDHQGPYWASLTWEVTFADTTTTADAFGLTMEWESPAGVVRQLGGTQRTIADILTLEAYGPIYIIRSGPGAIWRLVGEVGTPGDALISWRFAAMTLQSPDVIAF